MRLRGEFLAYNELFTTWRRTRSVGRSTGEGHLYVHVSYVINGCLAKVLRAIEASHILSHSNPNAFSLGRDRTTVN